MKTLRKPNGVNVVKVRWLACSEIYNSNHVIDLERGFGFGSRDTAYPVLTHLSSGTVLCYVKDLVDAYNTASFLCSFSIYPNTTFDWTRHTSEIEKDLTRLWMQGFDFKQWRNDKNSDTMGIHVRTWMPDELLAT